MNIFPTKYIPNTKKSRIELIPNHFVLGIAVILLISFANCGNAQLLSPQKFMPHTYGEEFTPHHRLVDYFYHVAKESPLVVVKEYGRTNQNRPLIYTILTSQENQKNIELIRLNNLRRAGILEGAVDDDLDKSIVWLSFGVHGNEAGASESSMMALYALATGSNGADLDWLKNTIVIIDPSINPDGYNRYTNWHINTNGQYKNTSHADNEHVEPWPSGRVNHYYHDLNRDWAWASQIETKQRLKIYHEWLPHVHADFHEMFPESPYYFAPAAEPLHKYVTNWQRRFQVSVGQNHAGHFDKNNWLYYTREQFDLFYPSYGDTYPMFNGAIGMTYEQAGHGVSGRAIELENGDVLTLQDRIDHHKTTALSTVEVGAKNYKEICSEFQKYFDDAVSSPSGKYRNYIINTAASTDASELLTLLNRHGIIYKKAKSKGQVKGFCFPEFQERNFSYDKESIIIPVKQPHGTMVQVLLEPNSQLSDSLTYDITAWSLLAAYGLTAVATDKEVAVRAYETEQYNRTTIEKQYAYAIPYKGWHSAKIVSKLVSQNVKCRVAQKTFTNAGHQFKEGTIVITHADNKKIELLSLLNQVLANSDIDIIGLTSGYSDRGPDIGSDEMKLMKSTAILLVGGAGTDQYNFGQIWNVLDTELGLPYTTVLETNFGKQNLSDYKTIILPKGYYPSLKQNSIQKLINWVKKGGKLIAFGSALSAISGEKGFSFKLKKDEEKEEEVDHGDHKLERYESSLRKSVSHWMPGAIVRLNVDNSHPLGFGLGQYYASLKLSSDIVPYQEDTWNVAYVGDELLYSGFIGNEVKEKLNHSNSFFVKDQGRGHVIGFVDNPLYRSFWFKGKQVFFNALFMVQ